MLTNKEAVDVLNFIKSVDFNKFKFRISGNRKIQKNLNTLEVFLKDLTELEKKHRTPSEEFKKMEESKVELLKKFCELDASGELVVSSEGSLKPIDDKEQELKEALISFNSDHAEIISEFNSQLNEWNSFYLQSDADIDLKELNLSDVVEDSIDSVSFEEFKLLSLLIPELSDDDKKE